jgi:uncharacterized membrane protein YczE
MILVAMTFKETFTIIFQPELRNVNLDYWTEIVFGVFPISFLVSLICVVRFGLRPMKSVAVALNTNVPLEVQDWRFLLFLNLALMPYLVLALYGWFRYSHLDIPGFLLQFIFWFLLMPSIQVILAVVGWSRTRNARAV